MTLLRLNLQILFVKIIHQRSQINPMPLTSREITAIAAKNKETATP
ncbi:hypothetical protein [Pleurocapsa sp. PCC 7319]|nr:hypothetical protein [Pleurocapsa sp. PCC 7319]